MTIFSKTLNFIVIMGGMFGLAWSHFAMGDEVTEQPTSLKKLKITAAEHPQLLSKIGQFTNLEELEIHCLESLEEIPDEIGNLKKLKVINIDNGNGCVMNPKLPETLGQLSQLQTLILYGAQDGTPKRPLPRTLTNLKQLKTLNIGRNGYGSVPEVVSEIPNLKKLDLTANDLKDLPDNLLKLRHLSEVKLEGNFEITCSPSKQAELTKRFKKIHFDFSNEYDCPESINVKK